MVSAKSLALAGFMACAAAAANAAVVFEADFNGSGNGTGGPTDIVTLGGTGQLGSVTAPGTVTVDTATPIATGGYLHVNQTATTGQVNVARFNTTASGGLNNLYAGQVNGFTALRGAIDMIIRPDTLGSGTPGNWFRAIDSNNQGSTANSGGLRLIMGGTTSATIANMQLQLAASVNTAGGANVFSNRTATLGSVDAGASGSNGAAATSFMAITTDATAPVSFQWVAGQTYHLAQTFDTDANGLITWKFFVATDGGDIDTGSTTNLVISQTFNLDNAVGGSVTGVFSKTAWDVKENALANTTNYDTFRIFNDVPANLAGVPEPTSLGLLGLAGVMGLSRRRRV